MKARQIRLRTCVGCGTVRTQEELQRFVRDNLGLIVENEVGINRGRGAYLCITTKKSCFEKAVQRRSFDRTLPVI
jgi:uncharacterized protein